MKQKDVSYFFILHFIYLLLLQQEWENFLAIATLNEFILEQENIHKKKVDQAKKASSVTL